MNTFIGDIYDDISNYHRQTDALFRRWGANPTAADSNELEEIFHNVQKNAKSDNAWKVVGDGHKHAFKIAERLLNRKLTSAESKELEAHFQRLSASMPGGSGFFANVAATLGDAAITVAKVSRKAFVDVVNSPYWKIAAGAAVFIPGIGVAVSAGMVTASAIGKAASVKDAIIGVARENMPGGDAAKAGFDVGVGVTLSGQGITDAGLQAIRGQLSDPTAQMAFDTALNIHVGRTESKAPAQLPFAGKAAYYASVGVVKSGAPQEMKAAVLKMTAVSDAAKLGLKGAVDDLMREKAEKMFETLRTLAVRIDSGDSIAIKVRAELISKAQKKDSKAALMLSMLEKAAAANRIDPPIRLYRGKLFEFYETIKRKAA